MLFELLLVSVLVVTAYQAQLFLRRGDKARRPYAMMLLADGGLALVSLAARGDQSSRAADMLGAVALGGFVCLVLVPPVLRDLARRAITADRLGAAGRLLELLELLQPGLGARQEREFVETVEHVRAGRVDAAVEALRERRARLEDPFAWRAVDERIVLTLLYARRWREAIEHFERTLEAAPGPTGAQVMVETVRAYGELGEMEKAADLLERIERSPLAREPMMAFLLARARMVFLAFAGRPAAVEAILAPPGVLAVLPRSAQSYWIGVARMHAGDAEGARRALGEAVAASARDPRARQVAEERLAGVMAAPPAPRVLPQAVAEVADRVARAGSPASIAPTAAAGSAMPRLEGVGWRRVPVTAALVAANLAVALAVHLLFGSSEDPGALVAAGANLKAAVRAGEWWRLHVSTFLHAGVWHLLLNMYGLWILGKLVEQMFGSVRFLVVYTLAGLGGAAASLVFGPDGISVGASGAVLGVLGAAIAELGLRRRDYHEAWRRAVFGNLVFLAIAQIVIGWAYPQIDQSAHVGGLVAGAAAAAALAPKSRVGRGRAGRALVAALLAACVASGAYGAWGVMTTSYVDTVESAGWVRRELGGVSMETPGIWRPDGRDELVDPALGGVTLPIVQVIPAPPETAETAEGLARLAAGALAQASDRGEPPTPGFEAPAGWSVAERLFELEAPWGRPIWRVAAFATPHEDGWLVVRFMLPDAHVAAMRPIVARIVGSVRP